MNNKDHRFPLGENDHDVLKRVKSFKKNFNRVKKKVKKKVFQSSLLIMPYYVVLSEMILKFLNTCGIK